MAEQLIGNYKILEQIGAGGMAKVYLAVHKDVPNLRVILKILTDSRLVERFRQEADKLALLDGNPNICRIKHFFNHGEDIVIAMEYIDGVTLEDKIKKDGPLPVVESMRIIRDVLSVLDFAHAKGICHRDIKPSNIMIDSSGNVKVIDFGIAKAESDPSLTLAGTACGTPPYMAPEQFTPSEDTNYALVDIYAVGTTLYHMLSGDVPFKGENEFAIRDAKLFTDPPSLKEKASGVSDQLDKLVMRSLKKEPMDRFASATEMIEAVECIRCKEEVHEPTSVVKAEPKPKKKLPVTLIAGAAAVVVVALVAIFGLQLFSGSPAPPPVAAAPEVGATVETATPTLHWRPTGADSYDLEYANNARFFVSETIEGVSDTFYTVSSEMENGAYYWRVRGITNGNAGEYSEAFSFTVEAMATGVLDISVTPSGDIYIDDELLASGTSSTSAELRAGPHRLRVVNEQSLNKEIAEEVSVLADTTVSVSYSFRMPSSERKPPAQPPAATLGELKVGSKPTIGADIYIDGELQSRKTPTAFRLAPGVHVLRVVLEVDGVRQLRADTVSITAGGSQTIMFDFDK